MLAGVRVARWFVFKPKIQIWEGLANGRCWYTLWTLGPFYGILLYFMDMVKFVEIRYILSHFGILYQEKSGNPGWSKPSRKSEVENCAEF
jgi:hypothetical protein